jgi:glycosyltransferase involved in cell wall biosynthesis
VVGSGPDAPLVSVALCTYNGERFLRAQLDSLLAQSHRALEIVALDDASTDASAAILTEYAARDARIRVQINPRNVGIMRNFEAAFGQCKGDFIAPCDQDDVWMPDKIASLLEAIGTASMAHCDSGLMDADGRVLGRRVSRGRPSGRVDDPTVFAFGNWVSGHTCLFRRELLAALPVPDHFFYDWWLAAAAVTSHGLVYVDRELNLYRQHASNATDFLRQRPSAPRTPGYRARDLSEIGQRLECLARLPQRAGTRTAEARDLWRARERQWLSPRLAWFMLRNAPAYYAWVKPERPFRRVRALKYLPGLRLKRLTEPYAFAGSGASGAFTRR